MKRPLSFILPIVFTLGVLGRGNAEEILVFHEPFEDTNWEPRGWYDSPRMEITDEEKVEGERACVWHWQKGATSPDGRGARVSPWTP